MPKKKQVGLSLFVFLWITCLFSQSKTYELFEAPYPRFQLESPIKSIVEKQSYPKDSTDLRSIMDALGSYSSSKSDLCTYIYFFDTARNITTIFTLDKGGDTLFSMIDKYENGKLIEMRKNFVNSESNFFEKYEYNEKGKIIKSSTQYQNSIHTTLYKRSPNGNLIKGKTFEIPKDCRTTTIFNKNKRTSRFRSVGYCSGSRHESVSITLYDANGEMKQTTYKGNYSNGGKSRKYAGRNLWKNNLIQLRISKREGYIDSTYMLYDSLENMIESKRISYQCNFIALHMSTAKYFPLSEYNSMRERNKAIKESKTWERFVYNKTFTYEFDKYNNWIKKSFYENGILIKVIEREITYYE